MALVGIIPTISYPHPHFSPPSLVLSSTHSLLVLQNCQDQGRRDSTRKDNKPLLGSYGLLFPWRANGRGVGGASFPGPCPTQQDHGGLMRAVGTVRYLAAKKPAPDSPELLFAVQLSLEGIGQKLQISPEPRQRRNGLRTASQRRQEGDREMA